MVERKRPGLGEGFKLPTTDQPKMDTIVNETGLSEQKILEDGFHMLNMAYHQTKQGSRIGGTTIDGDQIIFLGVRALESAEHQAWQNPDFRTSKKEPLEFDRHLDAIHDAQGRNPIQPRIFKRRVQKTS